MAERAASPKPRIRSKTRHEDMLNEAARQLNRNGFSLTSLSNIAEALKVSRRALYHYIEDREDLVYQCYVRSCDVAGQRLAEACASSDNAVEIVERLVELMLAPGQPELCAISESGLLSPAKQAEIERRYDAVVSRLAGVLEAGAKAGVTRPCDFEIAARCILGVIFWLPLAGPLATPLPPRDEQIAMTKAFILEGWAAEPRRLPDYEPFDVAVISVPSVKGFDRNGLAEAKREQILATASRLFNRKGIDSTSLEEIAGALGLTTMAIYHHVGNKATLVAECYFRMMRMTQAIAAHRDDSTQPALASIAALQHAWALAQMRDDIAPLNPTTGFSALSSEDQARFRDYAIQALAVAGRSLERDVGVGELRTTNPTLLRLNAGVTGWLARASITDPAQQEAAAREAAAFITVGIRTLAA